MRNKNRRKLEMREGRVFVVLFFLESGNGDARAGNLKWCLFVGCFCFRIEGKVRVTGDEGGV